MPGVVVNHAGAAVVQHVIILLAEISVGGRRNQGLEFANHDPLNIGVGDE